MEEYIDKLPYWARWVLALPSAALCACLGYYLAIFCFRWWNGSNYFWSNIAGTVAETSIFVVVLYAIIPAYKFLCSVIVNSLIGGIVLFSAIYVFLNGTPNGSAWEIMVNDLIVIGILIYYSIVLYKAEHPCRTDNSQIWS